MLLTIGMMVKNEEKYLEECLEALTPIREALDSELVIVDTGSDDNTVEIAKQFTDKVYFHEWNDNFSEMRNTVISYAKGDWYFSIDGDEVISNPESLINFFESAKYKKYNTALVTQKNYTNLKENRFSKILVPRLFKNDDNFHFEGAVHNQPQYKNPIIGLDTILDHYGYLTSDPELIERKFQRTSNILKEELEKDPENVYYWFQLSKSYNMHKDQEDALDTIEKAYEVAKKNNLDLRKRMYIYIQLSKMYLVNNRYKMSKKIAQEALAEKDGYVDLYYYLAKAHLGQDSKEKSLENFKEYIKLINNYEKTNSKVDTAVDDETMGNYNIAYRFIVNLAADLEIESDYAIDSAFKIEIDSQLQHTIHPFISICLNNNRYIKLQEFHQKKLDNEKLKQKFINLLEKLTANLNAEEKQQVYSQFTELDDEQEYNLLNKVRINLYQDDYKIEIEDLKGIDYNKQPDYFGDIIYYLLKTNESSAYNILTSIREENLNRFIKYLNELYEDLSKIIIKFIDYEIDGVAEARVNKSLSRYLLALDNDIEIDQNSKEIIDNYLSAGLQYIEKIYTEAVIEDELIYELKSKEEAFLLYMHKALDVKDSDLKAYIKYLRKAIDIYPLMKKVVETLLLEIKEEQDKVNQELEAEKDKFKANIEGLINKGQLEKAENLIVEYQNNFKPDDEIYSMKSVVLINKGLLEQAEESLLAGLKIYPNNFDLNFNLAFVYESLDELEKSINQYHKTKTLTTSKGEIQEVETSLNRINKNNQDIDISKKEKIVFFCKKELDKFIDDIIDGLSNDYETKKVIVTKYDQIDKWMKWADIVWFEWCDELVIYGSKAELARDKKIVCRLHSYEAFTNYINKVNWLNVDKTIFVAEHIREIVSNQIEGINSATKSVVIPNGVDTNNFNYKRRTHGYNLAYVGLINYKKGPMLALQLIKALVDINKKYKLFIAGKFEQLRYSLYFKQMIKDMNLQKNVFFEGWQEDVDKWLEDKDYIISSSVLESQHLSIMEAMSKGIKPVVHNFVGAKNIYPQKYIWNSINEAVNLIRKSPYNPREYKEFIQNNYSLKLQNPKIELLLKNLEKSNSIFDFRYDNENISFYLPNINDHIQKVIYKTGSFYEQSMLEDIKNRKLKSKIIVDVGSNIGNHTIYFSKICKAKKVYSFEPQGDIFEILNKNIQLNNLENKIDAFNIGLAAKKSKGEILLEDKSNSGMAKINLNETGKIKLNTLDNVLLSKEEKISLIKIDVEGMELNVLKGAQEILIRDHPLLYIEANKKAQFDKINSFLKDFGYKAIHRFNATPTYLFKSDNIN